MKMKIGEKVFAIAGTALLVATANVFAAGEADGQWFKLKYKTQNGLLVNTATGGTAKATSIGTCYTQLTYTTDLYLEAPDPTVPGYTGFVICEDAPGSFVTHPYYIYLEELPGALAAFQVDNFVSYGNSSGHIVSGYANYQAAIKLNKSGGFKKAKLQFNGELVDSSLDPANGDLVLVGGYTVIGNSIPESKLPFTLE